MNISQVVTHPQAFRDAVLIGTDTGARPLKDCIRPFQQADFEALDSAWLSLAGRLPEGETVPCRRSWIERPRGASKSGDMALQVVWILLAAVDEVTGVCIASDVDQSRLLIEAVARLVRLNELGEWLQVQRDKIINTMTGSSVRLLSSDAPSAYGQLVDFAILDECSHWSDTNGPRVWDAILSTVAKKESCLLLAILNAGWRNSWLWSIRESIRTDPAWRFSRASIVDSWITERALKEQEKLLPPKSYNRLFGNEWSDESGDVISREAIESCVVLRGPAHRTPEGFAAYATLDIGIRHDRSAVAVFGIHQRSGACHLLDCRSWTPPKSGEIDLADVERGILELHHRFRIGCLYCDPWNAAYLMSRLKVRGLSVQPLPFTPVNLDQMARELLAAFRDRTVSIYRHEELIADLCSLTLTEQASGKFKLDARRDERGHSDLGFAVAMGLSRRRNYSQAVEQRFRRPPSGGLGGEQRIDIGRGVSVPAKMFHSGTLPPQPSREFEYTMREAGLGEYRKL